APAAMTRTPDLSIQLLLAFAPVLLLWRRPIPCPYLPNRTVLQASSGGTADLTPRADDEFDAAVKSPRAAALSAHDVRAVRPDFGISLAHTTHMPYEPGPNSSDGDAPELRTPDCVHAET